MRLQPGIVAVVAFGALFATRPVPAAETPDYVVRAVADPGRPREDVARDAARRPAGRVTFAGIKPGDRVLELVPAAGYYTRILAKVVGPTGRLYAFAPGSPPRRGGGPPAAAAAAAARTVPENPIDAAYRLSHSREFSNVTAILGVNMRSFGGYIGLPEQVDVAWIADSYHNLDDRDLGVGRVAVNKAVFRDLKPGGVYLVIDHAAAQAPGSADTRTADGIDADTVEREVLAAGFVPDGRSPASTDSEEFMLRFRKPRSASAVTKRPRDSALNIYYGNTFVQGTPEQRNRVIFFHPDHTYQEFGGEGGVTNGIWYADADAHICMSHQTERAGGEGTVACRPLVRFDETGETRQQPVDGGDTDPVSLVKGYVYPNMGPKPQGPALQQPAVRTGGWADVATWPDLTTGQWSSGNAINPGPDSRGRVAAVPLNGLDTAPLKPEYAALIRAQDARNGSGGSAAASCEPMGVIADAGSKFYFSKDVIIISGAMGSSGAVIFRRVYLDRQRHDDPEPTYFGDSIGHWEGRTLVIDTVAIRPEAQLMSGVPLNSEATHMIERYRLTGPDTLELTRTVENADAFTRPWVTTRILHRMRNEDFIASYCWQDREANSGAQGPDITPPR